MPSPTYAELTSPTAVRNHDLCPWIYFSKRLVEPADMNAIWLTVELKETMRYFDDDVDLLQYVLMQIQAANANVHSQAQHYIRPRCLSIPNMVMSDSYEVSQAEASRMVEFWIKEVKAGRAYLDRAVLFDPRYLR
ncbi:hypothetical protein N7535_001484 [Penicillium sp. DV-2018c]|nr:hypothetical protein N7461_005271 [Penicillium sp. DV-2018c]KAJ5582864.1 hypothetical protein N7535_001484 [Penicillium sp. DV-2018c]